MKKKQNKTTLHLKELVDAGVESVTFRGVNFNFTVGDSRHAATAMIEALRQSHDSAEPEME